MSSIVVCPNQPLTRDLDVQVSISRPQAELATDMTLVCFLTDETNFLPNNSRVRFYSTMQAFSADFTAGTSAWWAGNAFFSRAERPQTLAVGAVFTAPQPAGLVGSDYDIDLLKTVSTGAFDVEINGALKNITGLDFTGVTTIDDVIAVLAVEGAANGFLVVEYNGMIKITTPETGESATLDYAAAPVTGVDVSALLGLTKEKGALLWNGYTPAGLVEEAKMVDIALRCAGRPAYGWVLDRKYRDTQDQKDFSTYCESKEPAYFSACTNSPTAYNTADITNIGYFTQNKGYKRTSVISHDNEQVYPDMSYVALALSVNYSQPDSALTMKFKMLDGIEVTQMDETKLTALKSRNINCYTAIGNTARTVREGVQSLDTWFTDSLVNLDNFREELQVEVYNVFLRNKKVPYTNRGQNLLVSAARKICNKYKRNGVFADRTTEDLTNETGFTTLPATSIIPVNVAYATTSERVSRKAPPIKIIAYEAGAFHQVAINVEVYN